MDLAIGLSWFMAFDFLALLIFSSLLSRSLATGALFAGVTIGIGVLLYRYGKRRIGLGFVLGFAIMTLVTGGACTGFPSTAFGSQFGGVIYFLIVVAAFVAAGIAKSIVAAGGGKP